MNLRFLLFTVVFWVVCAIAAVDGSAATLLADGYTLRIWRTEDGLPQNMVTSAVQTSDGYLWFGTNSGLARFNGDSFRVFDSANTPQIQDRRITRLYEDAQGTLWIGQESGGIACLRDGQFFAVATPSGDIGEKIIGLGSDAEGRLWAMHENGSVSRVGGDAVIPSMIGDEHPGLLSWSRAEDGRIFVMENNYGARLVDGELVPIELPQPSYYDYIEGIIPAAGGGAWVLHDRKIRKAEGDRWTEDRGSFPWPQATISDIVELSDGTLAVGTVHAGLYLIFGDDRQPVRFNRDNGLPQNWIRFLYEDREGTLWAGAGSSGLVSIHPSALSRLKSPDQWRGTSTLTLAAGSENSLWIGTDGAGLYHHNAGEWATYAGEEGLDNPYISAVTETQAGEVWAGNYWWGGPYRLDGDKFVRPAGVPETTSPVLGLLSNPATGVLLVGTRDGVAEVTDAGLNWLIKSPGGVGDDVGAMTWDREGALWCGFSQGGLARLADGQIMFFQREDGVGSNSVQSLFADDEDGSLWIGTADNGLTRFKDGRFVNLGTSHGLTDKTICYMLEDDRGYLWMSTRRGIQRVSKVELNRCADGDIPRFTSLSYDRSDGLPVSEFQGGRQGAGCRTEDGRIWFASSAGPISVDPDSIQPNPLAPPMAIESLEVDGQTVPLEDGVVPFEFAPDHERLEFTFSALSFVAPDKVRFKYKLEGSDNDWRDAGNMRFAQYSRLPAGDYRFRVIACNNDGVWNTEGASLAFVVAPFFWQTWWFVGACVLMASGMVASGVRYATRRRMLRELEDLERQHAVERERSRIAQDIHDDVGASLSRIAILSQTARSQLSDTKGATAVLSHIYGTARSVTRALDEIVWAVNPKHDTLDSLVDYMGKFAHDFLSAANVRCRLDLPVEVPPWNLSAEVRHNVFLAFKEALNNLVKHAYATEAWVHIEVSEAGFTIELKDNGRGLPDEADSDGAGFGNGLINMRDRMSRIGGSCEIVGESGTGTKVVLFVRTK
ncbi:two-component regulator propeller domain-containing protein [Pelagicoccus sp. SDUM812003]|uniref:sensor histidine kinase n=1 Tax=Pelagicoccus sp. SDUM812003 TaxID=3041267 RepID=UPI002810D8D7|nr:two-component regulator propeller domain-containing protein [Pelagicoccus sp. SDUM812003]